MKFITFICAFFMLFIVKGNSQENINSYKYVIVPNSFNFLKEADQYQLNSLTKFLFEKYGFTTLLQDDTYPEDLQSNPCLGLMADVENHKAVFNTKLQVHLKDCKNRLVYSSKEGHSREKVYHKAYNLALRDAFKSIEMLNYSYKPDPNLGVKTSNDSIRNLSNTKDQDEIKRLQKQVEALKHKQDKQHDEKQDLNQAQKEIAVKVKQDAKDELKEVIKQEEKSSEVLETLFANPVENGYTITDASSKVLYNLMFSGKEDVYIVKGQDAIVYKMNNTWIVATAKGSGISMKTLNVKFN